MARYRGFQDDWEHDDKLIETWNSIVTSKKDITYILGDITMEKSEHYYKLDLLNGVKHVVLGNHDRRQDVKKLLNYVDTVAGMIDHKGFILTHAPIHPSEISFCQGNIHAHIHHKNKLEEVFVRDRYGASLTGDIPYPSLNKYYNVDAGLLEFKPKTIKELINGR